MKTHLAAAAAALLLSTTANASSYVEIEPNDTVATAQILIHDGSINLTGFRESSPVNGFNDYFRFDATAGDALTIQVNAIGGGDPLIQLLDGAGNFITFDDDSGGGLNSLINYTATATGNYFLGVRGFSNSVYSYELVVTGLTASAGVPEPATWGLMILGFGAVGGAMRRRRSAAAKVRFA